VTPWEEIEARQRRNSRQIPDPELALIRHQLGAAVVLALRREPGQPCLDKTIALILEITCHHSSRGGGSGIVRQQGGNYYGIPGNTNIGSRGSDAAADGTSRPVGNSVAGVVGRVDICPLRVTAVSGGAIDFPAAARRVGNAPGK